MLEGIHGQDPTDKTRIPAEKHPPEGGNSCEEVGIPIEIYVGEDLVDAGRFGRDGDVA
jgi:hypothetical protein